MGDNTKKKIDRYLELNQKYLEEHGKTESSIAVSIDSGTEYLIRQNYIQGYLDGQSDTLKELKIIENLKSKK